MIRTISLALACAGSVSAAAGAAAPPQYEVRMIMQEGEQAPVRPTLIVASGEPATFMIANDSYRLHLTATPESGRVVIASDVAAWSPQGLRPDASRIDLPADGEPGRFSFRRTDPATGATSDVRIEVSARPLGH